MTGGSFIQDRPLSRRSVLTGLGGAVLLSATGTARIATAQAGNAMPEARIAMISTSVGAQPDGTPTGLWFSELTTPYWAFVDAGLSVDFASIAGGAPPIDPRSMTGPRGRGPSVDRFEASPEAIAAFNTMQAIGRLDAARYDAVFLCGGHGTMWDFRESTALAQMIETIDRAGGVVAAVCHGPAGLLAATRGDGRPLVAGRRVTGFSNAEEDAVDLTDAMPYLLEEELRSLGGNYLSVPNFEPHAIRDGRLVTGQNPASAGPTAELTIAALADLAEPSERAQVAPVR